MGGVINVINERKTANEVVTFRIASKLNIPATSYQKFDYGNEIFCASKLFIDNKNEEFVSLRHIEVNYHASKGTWLATPL